MALTAKQIYELNHMNGVSFRNSLGQLISDASDIAASEITLAEGNILIGNSGGVSSALNAKGNAKIIVGNGTTATSVSVSGDITLSNAGVVAIASGVIVNDDVKSDAAIAWSKMAALTDAHILVGSGTGVATDVAVSGDASLSNAGAVTVNKVKGKEIFTGLSVSEEDADATVTISVPGLVAGDVAMATLKAAANAVYVTKAVCGTDTIAVTLSGNGGAGTIVSYVAFKA